MARATVAGEHLVLVLTRREADAVERLLSHGLLGETLTDGRLAAAARRAFLALVETRVGLATESEFPET